MNAKFSLGRVLQLLFFCVDVIVCSTVFSACVSENGADVGDVNFLPAEKLATVSDPNLNEISGIAASISNPGCFWVHNDSGDKPRIFLINSLGQTVATVNLTNVTHRDWEDIATAADCKTGKPYIHIAETGDNFAQYEQRAIYSLPEPTIDTKQLNQTIQLTVEQTITFKFEDGKRDAETLLVDPTSNELYVVSKREEQVRVYLLPAPHCVAQTLTAKQVQTLNISRVVAGDISADGKQILIKNYDRVFYWQRADNETIAQTLSRVPKIIPYLKEPQGEGIAWLTDGCAFVTISEMGDEKLIPSLYIYRKNKI